jgi:hypothetical protein
MPFAPVRSWPRRCNSHNRWRFAPRLGVAPRTPAAIAPERPVATPYVSASQHREDPSAGSVARLSCPRWNRLLSLSGPTPSGPTPSGPNMLPLSPHCRDEANGWPVASLRAEVMSLVVESLGGHSPLGHIHLGPAWASIHACAADKRVRPGTLAPRFTSFQAGWKAGLCSFPSRSNR